MAKAKQKAKQKVAQKNKPKVSLKASLGTKKRIESKTKSKAESKNKSKVQAKPKALAKSKVQTKSKIATKSTPKPKFKIEVKQKAKAKKSIKQVKSVKAKKQSDTNLLTPLDDRILVKPLTLANRTPGGLIIPDTVELEKPSSAVVVSVGRGHLNKKGGIKLMDVKPGDKVLFAHYSAQKIEIQGEEYLLLRESDVLGIQV